MLKHDAEQSGRDPNGLWVACPACGFGHTVPASKVFWFASYLLEREVKRRPAFRRRSEGSEDGAHRPSSR